MTLMAQALKDQPGVLDRVLSLDVSAAIRVLRRSRRVCLVGTGSSQHAAQLGCYIVREVGLDGRGRRRQRSRGFPAEAVDAVVLITDTGETAFSRRVLADVRARPWCELVAITGNDVDWPEALAVAPHEQCETYTFSYTAALLTLAQIAGELGAPHLGESDLVEAIETARGVRTPNVDHLVEARSVPIIGAGPSAVSSADGDRRASRRGASPDTCRTRRARTRAAPATTDCRVRTPPSTLLQGGTEIQTT